jgi:hypothetical protein
VRPKEAHNLKTRESQRRVPVGEALTKKIMEQKEAEGKTGEDLIFPNTTETAPPSVVAPSFYIPIVHSA